MFSCRCFIYSRFLIFVSTALKPYLETVEKAANELTKAAANTLLAQNVEARKASKEPLLVLPLNPERMVVMEKASANSKLRMEFVCQLNNNYNEGNKKIIFFRLQNSSVPECSPFLFSSLKKRKYSTTGVAKEKKQ